MSRIVHDETDAIDFGGGDIVHIRRRMSYGQTRALSALRAEMSPTAATSEYLIVVLEQNVVRWEGPGFQNGTGPLPITRENLDALDPAVGSRLANEIAERNGVKPGPLATPAMNSSRTSADTAELSPSSTPNSGSANDSDGPGTS